MLPLVSAFFPQYLLLLTNSFFFWSSSEPFTKNFSQGPAGWLFKVWLPPFPRPHDHPFSSPPLDLGPHTSMIPPYPEPKQLIACGSLFFHRQFLTRFQEDLSDYYARAKASGQCVRVSISTKDAGRHDRPANYPALDISLPLFYLCDRTILHYFLLCICTCISLICICICICIHLHLNLNLTA